MRFDNGGKVVELHRATGTDKLPNPEPLNLMLIDLTEEDPPSIDGGTH